jgi:hypothetical protein
MTRHSQSEIELTIWLFVEVSFRFNVIAKTTFVTSGSNLTSCFAVDQLDMVYPEKHWQHWQEAKVMVQKTMSWRARVDALCSQGDDGD